MATYFVRRLLLVPVTFVAITFMVYAVLRVAPGGPIEQAEAEMRSAALGEAGGGVSNMVPGAGTLDEASKEELERYYNLDQPIPIAYLQWLGVWPREKREAIRLAERRENPTYWKAVERQWDAYRSAREKRDELLDAKGWVLREGRFFRPVSDADRKASPEFFADADRQLARGVAGRKELQSHLESRGCRLVGDHFFTPVVKSRAGGAKANGESIPAELIAARDRARTAFDELEKHLSSAGLVVSKRTGTFYHSHREFSGILEGDFGRSFQYTKPSLDVIVERFPISIYFGAIGLLATYIVCIPLGVLKAIQHRTLFDTTSSVIVFLGYATPGFVAALLLLLLFGGGSFWNLVPLGGFRSPQWETWWEHGEYWRCILDQIHHTIVPVFGYLVGSFASMTVLMKNSLMENLGADYVRTAFAKGLPERRVIFVHTLRNSLIPVTAGIGQSLGFLFAGSFLIEKVCNIPGMGLLGYEAILQRDYPIILSILVFGVLIMLVGNIISDLIWAAIDPRIRFH